MLRARIGTLIDGGHNLHRNRVAQTQASALGTACDPALLMPNGLYNHQATTIHILEAGSTGFNGTVPRAWA